jgi:RHS repeat-associated protein
LCIRDAYFPCNINTTYLWDTTLGQLAITDPFYSADNQTCTNTYDALARISSNSCTSSGWAQTFSYDAFGNVSKSGSISWQPNYNNVADQYQSGWQGISGKVAYDASGNLLNDTFNTYTWDAYGDLASANGASMTYDAFGRMVENNNGVWEFVYPPAGGSLLAAMGGQTLGYGYVPLPTGGNAIYQGSSLNYYTHPDWLGSPRLLSTPSRATWNPGLAYAPFGEEYTVAGAPWIQFTGVSDSFTVEDNQNETGTLDDFLYRRYNPTQGRWISPDPAGLAAVDPSNPQSWNRYAYVMNSPLSSVDPLGLFAAGYDEDGPGRCAVDGFVTPCGIVNALLQGDFGLECGNNCGVFGKYTGSNGRAYQYLAGVNGPVWIGPNGEELDSPPTEVGLGFLSSMLDYSLDSANNGPTNSATPPPCQAKILNATNNHFGTNYTDANVSSTFNYSTGAPPGQGTLNLNISGSTAGVTPGYSPVNWWTYVIGYGPTLHVVSGPGGNGGLDSTQTLQFGPNQATFHIDSGFPYKPIGAFFHWLLNMTKAGGYPQC